MQPLLLIRASRIIPSHTGCFPLHQRSSERSSYLQFKFRRYYHDQGRRSSFSWTDDVDQSFNALRVSPLLLLFSGLALFQNFTSAEEQRNLRKEDLLEILDNISKAFSENRYPDTIELANTILHFDPEHIDTLFWKASALLELRDYSAALKIYDQIISNPDASRHSVNQAHFFKAQTFQRMNQPKRAIEWYELCAVYNTDEWSSRAHYFLGKCYNLIGQHQQAISAYDRVIDHFPLEAPERLFAIIEKGMVLKQMNRLEEALVMFEAALQQYPNHPHLEKQRLLVLCSLSEYDRAIQINEERLQANPNDMVAMNFKAFALYRAGRYAEALPIYEQLSKAKGGDLNAMTAMGYCELQNGHAEKALKIFTQIAAKSPKYPLALTNIAICHHVMGHYEDAKTVYYEAIGLNPADQTAKQFLRFATQKQPLRHTSYPDPTRTYY